MGLLDYDHESLSKKQKWNDKDTMIQRLRPFFKLPNSHKPAKALATKIFEACGEIGILYHLYIWGLLDFLKCYIKIELCLTWFLVLKKSYWTNICATKTWADYFKCVEPILVNIQSFGCMQHFFYFSQKSLLFLQDCEFDLPEP